MNQPVTQPLDVRAALKEAIRRLGDAGVPSHMLAAELLLMHVLGCDRAWLYGHPEAPVGASAAERFFESVEKRAQGVPTQYLTGHQEFWGLDFEVTPQVLIPRPETEHVIEVALARLGPAAASRPVRIVDVGTGSGCIAIVLATELPLAQIFATDLSPAALEVARTNAAKHGVSGRLRFFNCDLLSAFHPPDARSAPQKFDLIVANPPYVSRAEEHTLPREVGEHEPHAALFGGRAGTEMYERLIVESEPLLPAGVLVLELGYNSLEAVQAIFNSRSGWDRIGVTNDLAGIPRVVSAKRNA
jgi:release factor glutamine methyltransferase